MSDLLTAPRDELIQLIYELTDRIEIQESELARVKAEKYNKGNSPQTKTPKGSETKAILTSLFDTWQLQNLNPLQQCRLLLTS